VTTLHVLAPRCYHQGVSQQQRFVGPTNICAMEGRVEVKQSRHCGDYTPPSIDCWRLESVELYSSPLYAFMAWTGKILSFMDHNCTSSNLEI